MKKLAVLLSVLISWVAFPVEGHATEGSHVFSVVDLGALPGGSSSFPSAVNDSGVIVGWANTPDGTLHAVRWDRAHHISDLGTMTGYVHSFATRVNKFGGAVGYVATQEERQVRAVRWSSAGELTDLGVLPAASDSKPFGFNDNGVAVGISGGPDRFRAVRWDQSGRIEPLGQLAGSIESWALDVNDHNMAVGYALTARFQWHAVRWDADGKVTDLTPDSQTSSAEHINDRGEVTGSADGHAVKWNRRGDLTDLGADRTAAKITNSGVIIGSTTSSGLYRPLRWTSHGILEELPVLPDQADQWAFVFDVNERGAAVGTSGHRPVIWNRRGGLADLGTLPGGGAARALHINNAGMIVGDAYSAAAADYRAVLWQG